MLSISMRSKLFLFLCGGLFWLGCNTGKNIVVPTYIYIDSFYFKVNPHLSNIPASSQITNVSVFYNNNPVGNFDLPATIPILVAGNGTLAVYPGIHVDGLNNYISPYPFYQPDTSGVAAKPGKIINRIPVTSFYNTIKPYLISGFLRQLKFCTEFGQHKYD